MGLSDGRNNFQIGLAVLIQYRSVTASHPASHVAVAITLNAKASSLKMETLTPCKIETLEQIDTQFVRIDYVHERNVCSKFGKNPSTGDFWAKG